jgi:hypothetical protein
MQLVRLALIGVLFQSRVIDEFDRFVGMRIGKEHLNICSKPAPMP